MQEANAVSATNRSRLLEIRIAILMVERRVTQNPQVLVEEREFEEGNPAKSGHKPSFRQHIMKKKAA